MLTETQQHTLALVREGKVFATPRLKQGRVVFVADVYTTNKDKEFTEVWLQDPHFVMNN